MQLVINTPGTCPTQKDACFRLKQPPNDAKAFAEAARGHWGIENGLHWCLDVAFREDDSRIRKGHAPTNMAIINRFGVCLIKQDPSRKIGVKACRKRAGWDTGYLAYLLRL